VITAARQLWQMARTPRAAVKAYYPGPAGITPLGSLSGAISIPYNYEKIENAYRINPWVFACVRRLSETVAALPLRLYKLGANNQPEMVDRHPILDLLDRPGRFWSGCEFIERIVASMALDGQFWVFADNGTDGQSLSPARLVELRPVRSQFVRVISDPASIIKGYSYEAGGRKMMFSPEFFIHGKTFNPYDDYYGLPPILVGENPILMQYYLDTWNKNFFRNSARPDGFLVAPGPMPLHPTVKKANLDAFNEAFGGSLNAHKVALLDGGMTWQAATAAAKDMEFINLAKLSREQVAAIWNMPPVMLGIFEYANYANSEQQLVIYYNYTIRPLAASVADALNQGLVWTWFDPSKELWLEFDLSDLEVLQEDALRRANEDSTLVRAGILTINDARARRNLPPVSYGKDDPRPGAMGPALLSRRSDDVISKARLRPSTRDQWAARIRDVEAEETTMARTMRQFFGAQRDRVLAAIRDLPSVMARGGAVPRPDEMPVLKVDPGDLMRVFDSEAEDDLLRATTGPVLHGAAVRGGKGALRSLEAAIDFNVKDPNVVSYLERVAIRVMRINTTTKDMLRDVLVSAAADNLTVGDTARLVRTMFEDMTKPRSLTIARTEMLGAYNSGSLAGFGQSGMVKRKVWVTTIDDNTRDSHAAIDNEDQALDDPFSNGLMFPGDDGPAEEVINCRCTMVPYVED
jgi:HK97 family phage portal protein